VRSIRSYLLTRLLAGAALVLVLGGLGTYLVVTRSLERQFDRNLVNRVQGFASILFQIEDELSFEFSDELMPEYERRQLPHYFQLRFADGTPIESSNSLGDGELRLPRPAGAEPLHWDGELPDGRSGRFVSQLIEVHHVYPEEGPDRPRAAEVEVVIAAGREGLVAAQRRALLQCALGALGLLASIALVVWYAVRRGLAPARRLALALDALDVERLPERLELGRVPIELASVAEKTEALVRRVDAALERERRTTADIAHELRTPITEVLTVSEVALRSGRNGEASSHALGTVRDVASRMGRSVSTLLKLARIEMGNVAFERESVPLGRLVGEVLRSAGRVAPDDGEGPGVENQVPADATVVADRELLRIVVGNLAENALTYAPRDGRVLCRFESEGERWSLTVENDAPELSQDDLRVLTQPFWRKDPARADRDRSGLGLALSRSLAEKAGLALELSLEAGLFRARLVDPGPAAAPRNGRVSGGG